MKHEHHDDDDVREIKCQFERSEIESHGALPHNLLHRCMSCSSSMFDLSLDVETSYRCYHKFYAQILRERLQT